MKDMMAELLYLESLWLNTQPVYEPCSEFDNINPNIACAISKRTMMKTQEYLRYHPKPPKKRAE
jgi:hypothetical protein